jgi:hypothetical protein
MHSHAIVVELDAPRTALAVRFTDVNGRLYSDARSVGFSLDLAMKSDEQLPVIVRVDLPRDSLDTTGLHLAEPAPEGACLRHGRGLDPTAHLTDAQDTGMLAFGSAAIPCPAH